jgi:hypothetical protein
MVPKKRYERIKKEYDIQKNNVRAKYKMSGVKSKFSNEELTEIYNTLRNFAELLGISTVEYFEFKILTKKEKEEKIKELSDKIRYVLEESDKIKYVLEH